jgi:hypothetical protein
VEPDSELIFENAGPIRKAIRRMVRYASKATERLDVRIEDKTLNALV